MTFVAWKNLLETWYNELKKISRAYFHFQANLLILQQLIDKNSTEAELPVIFKIIELKEQASGILDEKSRGTLEFSTFFARQTSQNGGFNLVRIYICSRV